jgi:hypothetical protein
MTGVMHDGTTLTDAARQWQTPQGGHPQKGGSQAPGKRRGSGHAMDLQDQTEYWQTPRTPQGGNKLDPATVARRGVDARGIKHTVDLKNQAELFPSLPQDLSIVDGLSFSERVRIFLQLCRQLRLRLPWPYNRVRSIFRPRLNPIFVDWLMGAPLGWSNADLVFSAQEMESYLSRLRSHTRFLLGG